MTSLILCFNLFMFMLYCHLNIIVDSTKVLQIEKYRIQYDKEIRIYTKLFDSNNRVLMIKGGHTNITDSTVYRYQANKNESYEVLEYLPDTSGRLSLVETHNKNTHDFIVYVDDSHFIVDTFRLYNENTFEEITSNFQESLTIDSIISDSGIFYIYFYTLNSSPFLELPFTSNNLGADKSDTLISFTLFCFNNKIKSETYHFRNHIVIRRQYEYNKNFLVSTITSLIINDKEQDSIREFYKYSYVNNPFRN